MAILLQDKRLWNYNILMVVYDILLNTQMEKKAFIGDDD
jgi:hypothetical protein